jgi:small basic protein
MKELLCPLYRENDVQKDKLSCLMCQAEANAEQRFETKVSISGFTFSLTCSIAYMGTDFSVFSSF